MSQHKTDTAGTILDAALETILVNKISGARLRQVARQANMSQGNLHYYFPTKDELYTSLLDHILQTFVEERNALLQDQSVPPQEKLRYFFDQELELIRRAKEVVIFFDFWVQGTKDAMITKIQGMYARWREDIRSVIAEGVQSGTFSASRASQMPALLASIMDGVASHTWMHRRDLGLF
jgi:AcrR family transcriptional regulator